MSQISADDHKIDPNFQGLFSFGECGKSNYTIKQNALTSDTTNLKFSFKLHEVAIDRPWMNMDVFQYTNIGIEGLEAGSWSNGKSKKKKNNGIFPLLPTHFLVAKDIRISAHKYDERLAMIFKSAGEGAPEDKSSLGDVMVCTIVIVRLLSTQM